MSVEDQLDRLINLIEMSVDLENPEKIQEIEKKYSIIPRTKSRDL